MSDVHPVIRKIHRIGAGLFLLSIIPAAIVSFQGDKTSPWVYAPLPFLFVLIITGTYQLVKPWIVRMRAKRAA